MLKTWMVRCLLALALLFIIPRSFATCVFSPINSNYLNPGQIHTYNITLKNATISVPPGTAIGQVIYRLTIDLNEGPDYKITCTTTALFKFEHKYLSTPLPLSGVANTYQTNLPGIGMRFTLRTPETPFPLTRDTSTNANAFAPPTATKILMFYLELVKTGDVTAGTIQSSSLPSGRIAVGQTGKMLDAYDVKIIGGAITVTTPTCNIAPASGAMTIQLGSYKANTFTGINYGTAWKNASIKFDCPNRFYGNSSNGTTSTPITSVATYDGKIMQNFVAMNRNMWEMTLTPGNGVASTTNSNNGIMKINDSPDMAYGIGIQLSSSASETNKINLANKITGKFSLTNTSTSVTVPLYARYIQTHSTVIAGKANGSLIYTISYR